MKDCRYCSLIIVYAFIFLFSAGLQAQESLLTLKSGINKKEYSVPSLKGTAGCGSRIPNYAARGS